MHRRHSRRDGAVGGKTARLEAETADRGGEERTTADGLYSKRLGGGEALRLTAFRLEEGTPVVVEDIVGVADRVRREV